MAGDPAFESFLARWLTTLMRVEAVSKPASALYRAIPTLVLGSAAAGFRDRLSSRVAGLKVLAEAIERDVPPPPPDSMLGRWLRHARRIGQRWDPSRWDAAALELSREPNPLMLAALGQALEEAIGPGPAGRQAVEQARALRAPVEREFAGIPLPPASQASWEPLDYLFPAAGRGIVQQVGRGEVEAIANESQGSPTVEAARALGQVFRQIETGWPVRQSALADALRNLGDALGEKSSFSAPLNEALAAIRGEATPRGHLCEVTDAGEPGPEPARRVALQRLDELAGELLLAASPEAREFGHRLRGLAALPATTTSEGLAQEFVGCLAFLDTDDGSTASGRWRASVVDRLARIAEGLGGGEILGDRLLGQPLDRWTEFVTVVGFDSGAPAGEPRRITRVDRVGYVLVFSDGTRRALVRARVWVALQ